MIFEMEPYILYRYDDIWNGFDFWSEYDILISIMNRFEM